MARIASRFANSWKRMVEFAGAIISNNDINDATGSIQSCSLRVMSVDATHLVTLSKDGDGCE